MLNKNSILLLVIVIFAVTGCSGRLFTVHKIDVQQGNAIDPKRVDQLQIGMNKEQVKFLMGSPLIKDSFHPDRWDYVYHLIPDYGDNERHHVAVFFEGNVVSNIEKSDIPIAETDSDATEEAQQEQQ